MMFISFRRCAGFVIDFFVLERYLISMDKRVSKRVSPPDTEPIEALIIGNKNESIDVGTLVDISEGGMGVRIFRNGPESPLGEVDIVLGLPAWPPFKAHGIVRHCEKNGRLTNLYGMQFLKIDERYGRLLRSYLNSCDLESEAV